MAPVNYSFRGYGSTVTPENTELQFGTLFTEAFEDGGLEQIVGRKHGPLVGEIDFIQGRPDFLCATYPSSISSWARASRIGDVLSSSSAANVLGQLKQRSPRTANFIRQKTGLSNGRLADVVSDLRSEKLVKLEPSERDEFALTSTFPQTELCVFELKLEKWRRAVYQALQYRVAANRVAIVMPSDRVHRIEPHAHRLRDFGVGVISLDWSSGEFKIVLFPRRNRPLSMRHYYSALSNYFRAIPESSELVLRRA